MRCLFTASTPTGPPKAFEALIADWQGILISDSYGLYRSWAKARQSCLAHLIRKAKGLSERKKPDLSRFGKIITAFLQQLAHFAKSPRDSKEWIEFYRHLLFALSLYEDDTGDAGKLARQILREIDSLFEPNPRSKCCWTAFVPISPPLTRTLLGSETATSSSYPVNTYNRLRQRAGSWHFQIGMKLKKSTISKVYMPCALPQLHRWPSLIDNIYR